MGMQWTADLVRSGEHGGGTAENCPPTRIRTANLKIYSQLRYHLTGVCCHSFVPPHCLEPSEHKLLTPSHPPLKKVISSYRG